MSAWPAGNRVNKQEARFRTEDLGASCHQGPQRNNTYRFARSATDLLSGPPWLCLLCDLRVDPSFLCCLFTRLPSACCRVASRRAITIVELPIGVIYTNTNLRNLMHLAHETLMRFISYRPNPRWTATREQDISQPDRMQYIRPLPDERRGGATQQCCERQLPMSLAFRDDAFPVLRPANATRRRKRDVQRYASAPRTIHLRLRVRPVTDPNLLFISDVLLLSLHR
jgi:hypothetical protein